MKTSDFNKLPKAQKRVLIAKDIIKQLNTQKLVANRGNYVNREIRELLDYNNEADIKKNYSKIQNCQVCALGACLLSATKFGNQLKLADFTENVLLKPSEKVDKLLTSIFPAKQMLLIETAFEGDGGLKYAKDVLGESIERHEMSACKLFRSEFLEDDFFMNPENEKKLLIKIMKNIIKNKGTFKP